MFDIIEIGKEYGLTGIIGALFGSYALRNWSNRKDIKDLQKAMGEVHDNCHIPLGAFKELKEEVDELKAVDHKLEKELAVMKSELKEIKTDVKQILMHFTLKGMDK